MTIIADTPEAIALVRATVIASGAALYINTGIKPNRMYTPTRMRDALNDIVGSHKPRNLKAALKAYVEAYEKVQPMTNATILRAIGR
jgi:hypothetical protein